MSAVNAKAPEPSMDEILASIRRIIADDADAPGASRTGGEKEIGASGSEPDLSGADRSDPENTGPNRSGPNRSGPEKSGPDGAASFALDLPEISFVDPVPPPSASDAATTASEPATPTPAAEPGPKPAEFDALVSTEATRAISVSFDTLSRTILSQNARTLEDLVKEMLRPMLRAWLDDNLPPLVERLVRTEIERVARGHR